MTMNGKIKQLTPLMMTWTYLFPISMATCTGTFGLMLNQQWQWKYRQDKSQEKSLNIGRTNPKGIPRFSRCFLRGKSSMFSGIKTLGPQNQIEGHLYPEIFQNI